MARFVSKDELQTMIGQEVITSDWLEITQARINQFADATNDHQFIHVDEEKAKATPFGGTIAHGFLTLSMLADLALDQAPQPEGCQMAMNYGFDKVRFLNPVKTGKKIRARATMKACEEKRQGQYLASFSVTVDIEGEETPALICDWLLMYFV